MELNGLVFRCFLKGVTEGLFLIWTGKEFKELGYSD